MAFWALLVVSEIGGPRMQILQTWRFAAEAFQKKAGFAIQHGPSCGSCGILKKPQYTIYRLGPILQTPPTLDKKTRLWPKLGPLTSYCAGAADTLADQPLGSTFCLDNPGKAQRASERLHSGTYLKLRTDSHVISGSCLN